jgi:hypothetical protein
LATARRTVVETAAMIAVSECVSGRRCDFCGKRGLNWGKPAQPTGDGGYAHVGCLDDHSYDEARERESLADAFEAWTP